MKLSVHGSEQQWHLWKTNWCICLQVAWQIEDAFTFVPTDAEKIKESDKWGSIYIICLRGDFIWFIGIHLHSWVKKIQYIYRVDNLIEVKCWYPILMNLIHFKQNTENCNHLQWQTSLSTLMWIYLPGISGLYMIMLYFRNLLKFYLALMSIDLSWDNK